MSDERLRRLERRWRETQDLHDRVAYLLESLRCGGFDRKRLRPAAILGDPAARLVMAEEGLGIISEGVNDPHNQTFMALAFLDRPLWARALIACLKLVPDPRKELRAVLWEAEGVLDRDTWESGFRSVAEANRRWDSTTPMSPAFLRDIFCDFLKRRDEDAAWDILQRLLSELARLPRLRKDSAALTGWGPLCEAIRDDLVPRLLPS